MKNNSKIYNKIMETVSKQVKKTLDEIVGQDNIVKTRRAGIQKKQVMKDLNPEAEKKRIDEFLELLDITDL